MEDKKEPKKKPREMVAKRGVKKKVDNGGDMTSYKI